MEQTFTQASVWGEELPKAFSAALDVYVASGYILKIHYAITTITLGKQLPLLRRGRLEDETAEKLLAPMVENRLRL
ncbi:hypothetical protein FIBSPDRAFT_1048202 [Athelia psychrophila]|uniref:Uncharacterized protein n=1 Tax=Athelia psychrophila TaxID=1759441 RepID=A0A166E0I1_9AGAM|nr:hypothetical protein FIBSPDRAFT_1048202 [Fibularhizoctonia sp. CBS 109695]